MQRKGWISFSILVNRFHSKDIKNFFNVMPKETVEEINKLAIESSDLSHLLKRPEDFFKNMHYSWLAPYVGKLSKPMQELTISSLPYPLKSGLKKYFKLSGEFPSTSPLVRTFFVNKLYEQMRQPDVLPYELLPHESLSFLLDLTRKELIELIDYLGLYDLVEDVRQMVDKKNLQKVYQCLGVKKGQFLRTCLHQKSKFLVSSLNLQKWNGDCSVLLQILHQRGLYRLGKAISASHPDFLWHLSHRLDTGRSAILKKYYAKPINPSISTVLVQQIQNVLNFIKSKSDK